MLGIFATPTLVYEVLADEAFGKKVEDYLMQNPDVLARALENLQNYYATEEAKRQRQSLLDNADDLYNSSSDFTLGPKNASVTIVEFFDYNCGYCKRVFQPLQELIARDDDIRLVVKEFPILSQTSVLAAQAGIAAQAQGVFPDFHAAMMTARGAITMDSIIDAAQSAGADIDRLQADMNSPVTAAIIDRTRAAAQALQISGTPGLVIGSQVIPGAIDLEQMREIIAAERAANI